MKIFKQFLCALFVATVCSGTLLAADVAEFKKVHGSVDIFHTGERKAIPASVGMAVIVGDIVRTGKRSRAQLKFADGSVLNIGSLSKIQVGEFSFSADSKVRKTSISDLRGKVRALVTKSTHKDSFFQVKTPGAVAAVRGTDFGTDVTSPTESTFVVYSGIIALRSTEGPDQDKATLLKANEISRVVKGQPPTKPTRASPQVLQNMSEGTQQVESSDADGGAGTPSDGSSSGAGSTTSTSTEGAVTTEGTSTTTTTTTTDSTGVTTELSTTTTSTVIPVTAAPAVAPPPPVVATPPIVVTTPAVNTTPVGIVIQF